MKFPEDPLAHPEEEAAFLWERFGTKYAAVRHAEWVLQHCAEKETTIAFWRKVIQLLKQ